MSSDSEKQQLTGFIKQNGVEYNSERPYHPDTHPRDPTLLHPDVKARLENFERQKTKENPVAPAAEPQPLATFQPNSQPGLIRRMAGRIASMHKTAATLMLVVSVILFAASLITWNTLGMGLSFFIFIWSGFMMAFAAMIQNFVQKSAFVANAYGIFYILILIAIFAAAVSASLKSRNGSSVTVDTNAENVNVAEPILVPDPNDPAREAAASDTAAPAAEAPALSAPATEPPAATPGAQPPATGAQPPSTGAQPPATEAQPPATAPPAQAPAPPPTQPASHIVSLRQDATESQKAALAASLEQNGGAVRTWYTIISGFAAYIPPSYVSVIRADPIVTDVQVNGQVSAAI
jgi:hypothetical protein